MIFFLTGYTSQGIFKINSYTISKCFPEECMQGTTEGKNKDIFETIAGKTRGKFCSNFCKKWLRELWRKIWRIYGEMSK